MKIGVVLAESNFIPGLSKGILWGLKQGVADVSSHSFEWVVEFSNNNAEADELRKILQKMIISDQVDVVCMPINPALLHDIKPLFEGNNVPLIALSAGEDALFNEAQSPYVLVNSYAERQACYALAEQVVKQGYRKVSVLASLHEGGYGLVSAFNEGLKAQGGELVSVGITHRQAREEDSTAELDRVVGFEPDCIVGFYSSKEAVSFLQHFEQGRYKGVPLFVNGSALSPWVSDRVGTALVNVEAITSWNPQSTTSQNQQFVSSFLVKCGRAPEPYDVLAYEVGLILGQAATEQEQTPAALLQHLVGQTVIGPRGEVALDQSGVMAHTLHHLQATLNAEEHCQLVEKNVVKLSEAQCQTLVDIQPTKQGWLNPYLIG